MKRIPVAFAVLIVLTGLCIGTLLWQEAQTNAMIGQIDKLLERFDYARPGDSLADADALIAAFERRTALFPLFLRHNGLSDVETELHTLPALLQKGEPRDVPAALVRCREKLQTLYELECPTPDNVF